ncbi:MAG TPA: RNA polymerase subunit sigma-70 [Polyangiaceae bacterium]
MSFENAPSLLEAHRRELVAYAYRMLGSLADAEDAVQDALERALRGLPELSQQEALRSWLYRITTNVCLDELGRAGRRLLATEAVPSGPPELNFDARLPEGSWLDPCPESLRMALGESAESSISSRESVSLAFTAALQHLTPVQRAVLVLRDVMGFSADEAARILARSPAAIHSALLRARAEIEHKRTHRPAALDAQMRQLLSSYLQAWRAGNAAAIVSLLAEDVALTMPPYQLWVRGRGDAARLLPLVLDLIGEAHFEALEVSGGPGIACWNRSHTGAWQGFAVQALSFREQGIAELHAFLVPALFPAFGLNPSPAAF